MQQQTIKKTYQKRNGIYESSRHREGYNKEYYETKGKEIKKARYYEAEAIRSIKKLFK